MGSSEEVKEKAETAIKSSEVTEENTEAVFGSSEAAEEKMEAAFGSSEASEEKTEAVFKSSEMAEEKTETVMDSSEEQMFKRQKNENSESICQKMLNTFPKLPLLADSQFMECVKIVPHDIGRLAMSNWRLGVNSFLSHGYYRYR